MSEKNTIFATVLLMEPMPKDTSIKHNNLNINVLPPPIAGGNTDDCPENLGNPYITQLIRPLLNRHQRQVADLSRRIEELEMKVADQKQTITSQAARCHQLDEENRQLREQIFHLKAIQPTLLSVKSSGLEKADATTTRTLNSRLEAIGLPSDIAEKLSARSITKVYDLIRLPESQLSRIDGITPIDLDTIIATLRLVGLRPAMDIRWVEALQEYYIKD